MSSESDGKNVEKAERKLQTEDIEPAASISNLLDTPHIIIEEVSIDGICGVY